MKYLIVDDNAEMRKLISQSVCSDKDTFMECSDGNEAFAAYTQYLPDYVLMDIQMKKMNGIEAAKKIHGQFPAAFILIVTNHDTYAFRKAALEAGASAFFSKENLFEVKNYINTKLNKTNN